MYLCCDLGGSTAVYSVFNPATEEMEYVSEKRQNSEYRFEDQFSDFLNEIREFNYKLEHATIAAAGPVDAEGSEVKLTRGARWRVDKNRVDQLLHRGYGYPNHVSSSLINDFQALGYGLLYWDEIGLREEDFDKIYVNRPLERRHGELEISLVCGPGTGLGVACLVSDLQKDGYPYVITSEGGHLTFAPERATHLRFLQNIDGDDFQRRSFEDALSGPGMKRIYNGLNERQGINHVAIEPRQIVENAKRNQDKTAVKTLNFFCEALAMFCGNMALAFNCNKAIYLWGGTLRSIDEAQLENVFDNLFPARKFRDKLANIAVLRVRNEQLPLFGCANYSRYFLRNRER